MNKRKEMQQMIDDLDAKKALARADAELLFGKAIDTYDAMVNCDPRPEIFDQIMDKLYPERNKNQQAMEKEFKIRTTGGSVCIECPDGEVINIECPDGWEIKRTKDGVYTSTPVEPKKDLNYWWRKYCNDSEETFAEIQRILPRHHPLGESNILNYKWFVLMDFYRWLAERLNEGKDMSWESIYWSVGNNKFNVVKSIGIFHLIRHTPGTAQQVIDILGTDLLKKIFQIK